LAREQLALERKAEQERLARERREEQQRQAREQAEHQNRAEVEHWKAEAERLVADHPNPQPGDDQTGDAP
jgi:hypothetical protein